MPRTNILFKESFSNEPSQNPILLDSNCISFSGGLFLDNTIPSSIIDLISFRSSSSFPVSSKFLHCSTSRPHRRRGSSTLDGGGFLSVSLSIKGTNGGVSNSADILVASGGKEASADVSDGGAAAVADCKKQKLIFRGRRAMNTTKHLWAGAVAAMVSRFVRFCTKFVLLLALALDTLRTQCCNMC